MKISKIFAGMSAAAIAMTMLAIPAGAADEAEKEEATPIATAYIAYGADAWVLDPAKVSGTIEVPATGSWWDEKEVPLDTFTSALAEGKTLEDVASITFGTSSSAGNARNFTIGYNSAELDDAGKNKWGQPAADATVKTITPALDDNYYLKLANNTDADMKVDFVINYKDTEGLDDPHLNMWVPVDADGNKGWNNYYYDESSTAGVKEDTAEVYSGKEFTLTAYIGDEIDKMWFIAPTVVFGEEFGKDEDINSRYEVSVALKIDDVDVKIDDTAKKDDDGNPVYLWAEDTGANSKSKTARLLGGYNEWADKFVDGASFKGAHKVSYTITVTDTAEPEGETNTEGETNKDGEKEKDTEKDTKTTEKTEEKKTEGTGTTTGNPKTAAVLGLGAIALAGAAAVVAKKRD